jgi:ATP-dependent RNA helicase RhlE
MQKPSVITDRDIYNSLLMQKFEDLGLVDSIKKAIVETGYTTPTEIQQKAIPLVLAGEDMIGCAQTGTGKTGAFAIPVLQLMDQNSQNKNGIKTLVLSPTRELAIQIDESFKTYGKHLRIRSLCVYGGVSISGQISALKQRPDILIATPGRLLDLIGQKQISLSQVNILVLDEADRMLDMGFVKDVKKILSFLKQKKQTLFFSATMPPAIRQFANTILVNPKEVFVTPPSSTAETIQQSVYYVDQKEKAKLLIKILKGTEFDRTLVFTRTKHGADRLVKHLSKEGITSAAIHGNKSQNNRVRAIDNFKTHKIQVLVATDIAARGIDIDNLSHMVNYEIPEVAETYVHRIGRTGRAGGKGQAVSLCDETEVTRLKNIQRLTGVKIPELNQNEILNNKK